MNEDLEEYLSEGHEQVFIKSQQKEEAITYKDATCQIVASCISFSIVLQVGANMSFSSVLVPQLAEKDSPIHITRSQASWIASIVAIALPLGALLIGPLLDMYGRKRCCILITAPFVLSWIFQIYATELWHFYIARIIAGFSGGLSTAAIVYVSEITHPSLRQALLSLNSVFVSFGVLLTYLFGTLFRWRMTAILLCAASALTGIGMIFLPESPYWCLIFKNEYGSAQRAFRFLYKRKEIYESQYQHLLLVKSKARNISNQEENNMEKLKGKIRILCEKTVYKPTIILVLIFFAQQITGGYVIIFYATDIFRKLDGQNENQGMSEMASLVLLGIIRFLASVVAVLVSKSFGRRSILMTSGVGMAFCSFVAGLYIYFTVLSNEQIEAMNLTTGDKTYNIAFIFVLGYVAFGSLGFLVIPWTLIGELLPVKVRGLIGGFLVSFAYIMMFMFVKIFPTILASIDIHSIFCVVSILNLVSVMFIYFFLPETLGRNFTEIENYFER
ncbi:solute carrier family 2, facilitated glucose transporter member 8-like isoform X2 [Harmonia axyridis]|nr:solute carrier family 2, facilitated glucose transporter member 8-like isoform X2 [Harmonia axyridis]